MIFFFFIFFFFFFNDTATTEIYTLSLHDALPISIKYGISIIVIYIVLGTLVTWLFGAESLNAMSTDPIFNFIFFLILVIFAISFLGAFEISLPSSWANKADSKADRKSVV